MSRSLIATEEIRDELGQPAVATKGMSARALARELAVSESTIRRHADLLIKRGWVTKTQMAYGTRQVIFTLTRSGRDAYAHNVGF